MQNKKQSLIEAITNTFIGFIINLLLTPIIYKLSGIEATFKSMGLATLFFTIIAIIRGYVIRRYFNKL